MSTTTLTTVQNKVLTAMSAHVNVLELGITHGQEHELTLKYVNVKDECLDALNNYPVFREQLLNLLGSMTSMVTLVEGIK